MVKERELLGRRPREGLPALMAVASMGALLLQYSKEDSKEAIPYHEDGYGQDKGY